MVYAIRIIDCQGVTKQGISMEAFHQQVRTMTLIGLKISPNQLLHISIQNKHKIKFKNILNMTYTVISIILTIEQPKDGHLFIS